MDKYILIPALNPGKVLEILISEIRQYSDLTILIVDDGSNPSISLKLQNLKIIRNENNKGKGNALKKGFEWGLKHKLKYVITLDSDGQHSPTVLKEFIEINEDIDFCLGYREFSNNMPIHRRLSNYLTSKLVSIRVKKKILDSQCGYRSYNLQTIAPINFVETGFMFETEILLKSINRSTKINNILIPTIYGDEISSIRNFSDTINFIILYLRSFFYK